MANEHASQRERERERAMSRANHVAMYRNLLDICPALLGSLLLVVR